MPGMPFSCWNGPGLCQKRKPIGSLPGTPPAVIMMPRMIKPRIVMTLRMENLRRRKRFVREEKTAEDWAINVPEFGFPVPLHAEEVEATDDDEEHGDPDRDVDVVTPVLDDESGGGDFLRDVGGEPMVALKMPWYLTIRYRTHSRESDGVGVPVVPSEREAERWINETRRVVGERAGDRVEGRHLSQSHHHCAHNPLYRLNQLSELSGGGQGRSRPRKRRFGRESERGALVTHRPMIV